MRLDPQTHLPCVPRKHTLHRPSGDRHVDSLFLGYSGFDFELLLQKFLKPEGILPRAGAKEGNECREKSSESGGERLASSCLIAPAPSPWPDCGPIAEVFGRREPEDLEGPHNLLAGFPTPDTHTRDSVGLVV